MPKLLKRSPYNLRPRITHLSRTCGALSQPSRAVRVDVDVTDLARVAQVRQEAYLAGEACEDDDPVVDDGSEQPRPGPLLEDATYGTHNEGEFGGSPESSSARGPAAVGLSTKAKQARRGNQYRNKLKKRAREEEREGAEVKDPDVTRPTKRCAKRKKQAATPYHTEFAFPDGVKDRGNPVASSAFVGKLHKPARKQVMPMTRTEGEARGLEYLDWDGVTMMPILDKKGRTMAMCGGSPANFDETLTRIEEAYRYVQARYHFTDSQMEHRRGPYPAVGVAISFGGGQQRVGNLKDSAYNRTLLRTRLLLNPDVKRMAGFVDSCFVNVAPELHRDYARILRVVCEDNPALERPFNNSVFAGVHFNFGPQACTVEHTDHLNIPTGWCAVMALGNFNADEGGHLILWDLNVMIRFPRGSVIYLPSALIRHSNTAVPAGQTRYSFTQYTAGGLARWVECGCMSQKSFLAQGGKFTRTPQERWEEGLAKLPTWDTWHED